ncbi:hypothetical protein, partial [Methylobacter sp.]|uniref:hypothetical protein n=1 Tax=Methylobacter sp. TaxID=2051955 RepID=UPI003DA2D5F5
AGASAGGGIGRFCSGVSSFLFYQRDNDVLYFAAFTERLDSFTVSYPTEMGRLQMPGLSTQPAAKSCAARRGKRE